MFRGQGFGKSLEHSNMCELEFKYGTNGLKNPIQERFIRFTRVR